MKIEKKEINQSLSNYKYHSLSLLLLTCIGWVLCPLNLAFTTTDIQKRNKRLQHKSKKKKKQKSYSCISENAA